MRYKFLNADNKLFNFSECKPEEIVIIHDIQTELDWEVKSSDPTDERFFKRLMTWNEFKGYVNYLNEISCGSFKDWRVPSKHELRRTFRIRTRLRVGYQLQYRLHHRQKSILAKLWAGGSR